MERRLVQPEIVAVETYLIVRMAVNVPVPVRRRSFASARLGVRDDGDHGTLG